MPITKYVQGDLMDHPGPIAHGVNCQGKMNSGVARVIRERYPEHYKKYMRIFNMDHESILRGVYLQCFCGPCHNLQRPDEDKGFAVWGIATQENYGYDGRQYVDYARVKKGFYRLNRFYTIYNQQTKNNILGIPKIGAGLGGGDWNTIESIINEATPNLEIWVYVI